MEQIVEKYHYLLDKDNVCLESCCAFPKAPRIGSAACTNCPHCVSWGSDKKGDYIMCDQIEKALDNG